MKTLGSTLAGTWYPGTEREIRAVADRWEGAGVADEATPPPSPNVLVLPHAGWDYSGMTAWRAVRLVRGALALYLRHTVIDDRHIRGCAAYVDHYDGIPLRQRLGRDLPERKQYQKHEQGRGYDAPVAEECCEQPCAYG